jgi:hypothetical protein
MTTFDKPVRRVTREAYKHFKREIVVSLYADTISLRLKGTRTGLRNTRGSSYGRPLPTRGEPNSAREAQPTKTIVTLSCPRSRWQ